MGPLITSTFLISIITIAPLVKVVIHRFLHMKGYNIVHMKSDGVLFVKINVCCGNAWFILIKSKTH